MPFVDVKRTSVVVGTAESRDDEHHHRGRVPGRIWTEERVALASRRWCRAVGFVADRLGNAEGWWARREAYFLRGRTQISTWKS